MGVGLPETIETARLYLRPFSAQDAPAVLDYSCDTDWREYQRTAPTSAEEAAIVVAQLMKRNWNDQPVWAVTRAALVIGLVSLVFDENHRIALLGYGIHRDHRRSGLTREAVCEVLSLAFSTYPELARVVAKTDVRNHGSNRLLEELGFAEEKTLRSLTAPPSQVGLDGATFGLSREQWLARFRA